MLISIRSNNFCQQLTNAQDSIYDEIMKIQVFFFLIIILASSGTPTFYNKIIHNTDPNARCLDGSSPAVYLHQGSQRNKILFHVLGGASCVGSSLDETLKACLLRSKTQLGSSSNAFWPQLYPSQGFGMFDITGPNNRFVNWTKIILLYCDGVLFQGNNAGPVSVSGTNIYFRGSVNMRSHLKWANKRFNFEKAEKIVFTGSSSGGIATYLWIDYLKGLVSNPKKVYGIVDSGIFLSPVALQQFAYSLFQLSQLFVPTMPAVSSSLSSDSGTVRLDSQKITTPQVSAAVTLAEIMTVTNANQRPPNKKCTDSLAGNSSDWKCLFADYAIDYLQSKLLWIQSQYDTYVIQINLMMTCLTKTSASRFTPKACTPTQLLQIEVYRNLVRSKIFSKLVAKGHSVWSIACSWHTSIFDQSIYYSSEERSPAKGNRTGVQGAAESFVFQNALIRTSDPYPWPSNTQCAY